MIVMIIMTMISTMVVIVMIKYEHTETRSPGGE